MTMADKNYGLATVVADENCTTQRAPNTSDTGDHEVFEVG